MMPLSCKRKSVNGTPPALLRSVAPGRGRTKASSVAIQRNPWRMEPKSINIGTWNIRTMLKPGKLANIIREMEKANLDILGLCEVRWKDSGDFYSEGVRIIYAGGKESQRGVAILLRGKIKEAVQTIERYDDRILVVKIKAEPVDLVIIEIYMPTTNHAEEERDEIFEQLESILERQKGTDYVVLMGDWNAVVGEGKNTEENCIGDYGLGK